MRVSRPVKLLNNERCQPKMRRHDAGNRLSATFPCVPALFIVVLLTGCAGLNDVASTPGADTNDLVAIVGRFPLPEGSRLKVGQSMIVGGGERWIGQIRMEVPLDGAAAYAFFMKRLPLAGWSQRSGVLGKRTMMHFSGNDRVLSIDIESGQWSGSLVTLTATPDGMSGKR